MSRIQSLNEFWPFYLSEHRSPTSRKLHFVGTSWFLGSVGASFVLSPVFFPPAFLGMVGLGYYATKVEGKKPAFLPMAAMIGLTTAAAPLTIPAGIVGAYAMAWIGHFKVEHNRPATFKYPVWSLVSDVRMWGHMVRGRLWKGDPLDELNLRWEAPAQVGEDVGADAVGATPKAEAVRSL
jgi:hypothetical protein